MGSKGGFPILPLWLKVVGQGTWDPSTGFRRPPVVSPERGQETETTRGTETEMRESEGPRKGETERCELRNTGRDLGTE